MSRTSATAMRWLNQPLPRAPVLLSAALLPSHIYVQAAPTPQAPGEPTDGALSLPVNDTPGNPSAAHPGAPTVVAGRQETLNGVGVPAENPSPTYNDGMYTPWTPTTEEAAPTAVGTPETTAPIPDNSVYLQPSPTSGENAEETTAPVVTSSTPTPLVDTSSTIPTTPPSTSTQSSSSSSAATVSPSSSSSSSSGSPSSPSSVSRSGTLDAARQTSTTAADSSNTTRIGVIIPVVLSLAALALILGGIGFLVWRRRVAKRRGLAARRYDEAFAEKGGEFDDEYDSAEGGLSNEKGQADWQTFNRYSAGPYDGIESGMAGAGVRSLQTPQPHEDDPNTFRPRESRRPLPMTPQQVSTEYASMPTLDSTSQDLDAMIAHSRTGYAAYANRPQRNKSIMSDIAGSIYSSLSLRSKRSRTGTRGLSKNDEGNWDEHGAWQPLNEPQSTRCSEAPLYRPTQGEEYPAGSAQDRPLLSAVDETPRKKKGYSTYTPPESPSRETLGRTNGFGVSRIAPPTRGHALNDNPVPSYNPYAPKRTQSSASARSEIAPDTPSIYSVTTCEPMSTASPQSSYPDTLQPGRSPALGRGVTPPLPSQSTGNGALYRQKSGTTYSLGGVAGILYNEQQLSAPPTHNSYTAIPPRKPRKQSILSKYKPRTAALPLSDEATAGETDAPSPHRAVSAVVRASRARGSSVDSHYSAESPSTPQWNDNGRYKLGHSQVSNDSIDDLLSNVLGPSRSPA